MGSNLFYYFRRHHCPHPTKPKTDIITRTEFTSNIGATEYKTIFLPHNARPRGILKPPQRALTHDAPMTCDTTNRLDYVRHSVSLPVPRPPPIYKRPEGTMNKESEYKKEFRSKTPEPVKPALPPLSQVRTTNEPFLGQSTQAGDFIAYELPPREFHGERRVYEPPTEPFAGISTMQSDYIGASLVEPTKSVKPSQTPKLSREPFQNNTCHKDDYRSFPIPERFQAPKQLHQPPDEPFNGVSTFTTDFPGHRGVKPASSLKPPITTKTSHASLDSLTISRQSYRKWEIPPRYSRPPTVYEPPKEKFDARSLFSNDFVDYGVPEPTVSYKPKMDPVKHTTPLEKNTVHRLDFQPWDVTNRQLPIRQERPYEPPIERFEAMSTTSEVYRGEYAPPASTAKPQLKAYSKKDTFDGQSTYKESFSRGGFRPDCITRHPTIPGYQFSHQDSRTGHKFYIPVPAATPPQPDTNDLSE